MSGGPMGSLDVHWPPYFDSGPGLSSIGAALGYGNQIDDYSLAMAAPPSVWGTNVTGTNSFLYSGSGLGLGGGGGGGLVLGGSAVNMDAGYGNGSLFNMHVPASNSQVHQIMPGKPATQASMGLNFGGYGLAAAAAGTGVNFGGGGGASLLSGGGGGGGGGGYSSNNNLLGGNPAALGSSTRHLPAVAQASSAGFGTGTLFDVTHLASGNRRVSTSALVQEPPAAVGGRGVTAAPAVAATACVVGVLDNVAATGHGVSLQQQPPQPQRGAVLGGGIGGGGGEYGGIFDATGFGLVGDGDLLAMSAAAPLSFAQQQQDLGVAVPLGGTGVGGLGEVSAAGGMAGGGALASSAGNVVVGQVLLTMPNSIQQQQQQAGSLNHHSSNVTVDHLLDNMPGDYRHQLTSMPDLADLVGLSDYTDLPAIPAVGTQAYNALKPQVAQTYRTNINTIALPASANFELPHLTSAGPLASSLYGGTTLVAPPQRFADLSAALDNRLMRQAFAAQSHPQLNTPLPPPLLGGGGGGMDLGHGAASLFSPRGGGGPGSLAGMPGLPGGSLVLDGARGELINISKMTPQEILDAKALAASKNHSEAERRRRERINTHLGTLRTLLPSSTKTDKASLLGEVIEHVKGLKRQAAEVEGPVPSEIDELTVERGEPYAEQPGRPVLKVTVSCDDRPGVLTDLGRALDACKLENFHMELATISGRIKVVMQAYSTDEALGEAGVTDAFMGSVQEALRVAVDKAGDGGCGGTDNSSVSSGGHAGGGSGGGPVAGMKRQRTSSNSPP